MNLLQKSPPSVTLRMGCSDINERQKEKKRTKVILGIYMCVYIYILNRNTKTKIILN